METARSDEMDPDDLMDPDEAILDALKDGRATKGALIDWTGYSRNTVYHRLQVLEAAGLIECAHEGTRLFELVEDPRDSDDRDDNVKSDGVGRVERTAKPQVPDLIDQAFDGWRPGYSPDDRQARLASARQLLEWLRNQDEPRQRKEIEAAIGDELMLEEHDEFVDGWWKSVGLPAIRRARELDLVELEGNSYRWVDE